MVRKSLCVCVCAALLLTLSAGAVFAGEYYLSDQDAYWWYWDGAPDYEVLIPSSAFAYVQVGWGGQTALQVAIEEQGSLIMVGTLPGTDLDQAWKSMTAPWSAAMRQAETITNTQIQTDQGLTGHFRVLEGTAEGGPKGLVRMVAFIKGGRLAYLMFVGNEREYTGEARQFWLRAVHSFRWR